MFELRACLLATLYACTAVEALPQSPSWPSPSWMSPAWSPSEQSTTTQWSPGPSVWSPGPHPSPTQWTTAPQPSSTGLAYPRQKGPDYDYTGFEQNQTIRAQQVIDLFRFAWTGYYTYAYPHDDLLPQNNSYSDSRNGWGLLMFDALDTAIIMEQEDIVNIILEYVPTVDFTKNNAPAVQADGVQNAVWTSLFETNIRYLGGMLSSYDLLKGPFSHLDVDDANVDALLTQAQSLADTLKFAFDTPSGVPVNAIYIDNQSFYPSNLEADGTYWADLAELGTLVLEWQHLSDLTGDPSYGELAQRSESAFFNANEVWPGLTGSNYSVQTGQVQDQFGGWTGGNDSAYEYLIKMYVYDPDRYQNYSQRWQMAADSSIEHLLSHPSSRPDLTMLGAFWGTLVENYTEHLACFAGGNFILGSTVLGRPDYMKAGLEFCEFCANIYRYSPSGIPPPELSWNTTILSTANYTNQTSFYEESGWFIPDNTAYSYGQVPEATESWYYAYQVTGDQYWRDVAWAYVLAENTTERVGSGFGDVNDVLVPGGNGTMNFMASFMLAEVLKYQYIIQKPEEGIYDVEYGPDNKNYFVFNTEAHPFKVAAKVPV